LEPGYRAVFDCNDQASQSNLPRQSCTTRPVFTGCYLSFLVFTGIYWSSVVFSGLYWYLLVFSGLRWSLLVFTSLYWSSLVSTGLHWSSLVDVIELISPNHKPVKSRPVILSSDVRARCTLPEACVKIQSDISWAREEDMTISAARLEMERRRLRHTTMPHLLLRHNDTTTQRHNRAGVDGGNNATESFCSVVVIAVRNFLPEHSACICHTASAQRSQTKWSQER
jgi:hypothetical protein